MQPKTACELCWYIDSANWQYILYSLPPIPPWDENNFCFKLRNVRRCGSTESLPLTKVARRFLRRKRTRDQMKSLEHSPRSRSMSREHIKRVTSPQSTRQRERWTSLQGTTRADHESFRHQEDYKGTGNIIIKNYTFVAIYFPFS